MIKPWKISRVYKIFSATICPQSVIGWKWKYWKTSGSLVILNNNTPPTPPPKKRQQQQQQPILVTCHCACGCRYILISALLTQNEAIVNFALKPYTLHFILKYLLLRRRYFFIQTNILLCIEAGWSEYFPSDLP